MHNLIIGMTMSGKTTLAKLLIGGLKAKGQKVAVLDPLGDPSFAADFQTKDSDEFLAYAKRERDCFLFVDEAGSAIGRYNPAMEWLATTGRHCGHLSFFITQGVTQLSPIVRGQCDKIFMFACAASNGGIIAEEWNQPQLLEIDRLERYHFFIVSRFAALKKGSISLDKPGGTYKVNYDNLT